MEKFGLNYQEKLSDIFQRPCYTPVVLFLKNFQLMAYDLLSTFSQESVWKFWPLSAKSDFIWNPYFSEEEWKQRQAKILARQEQVLSECKRRMPNFVDYCEKLAAENEFLM